MSQEYCRYCSARILPEREANKPGAVTRGFQIETIHQVNQIKETQEYMQAEIYQLRRIVNDLMLR